MSLEAFLDSDVQAGDTVTFSLPQNRIFRSSPGMGTAIVKVITEHFVTVEFPSTNLYAYSIIPKGCMYVRDEGVL